MIFRFSVEKMPHSGILTVIPQMLRVPFCDDPFGPLVKHNHSVRDCEDTLKFVGYDHHGCSKAPVEVNDQVVYSR